MTWNYVAGFFDGEGYVRVSTEYSRLVFYNTHLATLEEIQRFLGCGKIYLHPTQAKLQCYRYEVIRQADALRVGRELLDRCLIKRAAIARLIADIEGRQRRKVQRAQRRDSRADQIRDWYWDDGLSQKEIGLRLGLDQSYVSALMRRNGVARRAQNETKRLARTRS